MSKHRLSTVPALQGAQGIRRDLSVDTVWAGEHVFKLSGGLTLYTGTSARR